MHGSLAHLCLLQNRALVAMGRHFAPSKNASFKKIKEITREIRLADLGIQNEARLKQEKEEKKAYEKIWSEAKIFYSYARNISHRIFVFVAETNAND